MEQYYAAAGSHQRVHGVKVPLLVIQADDDPIAPIAGTPVKALHDNPNCILAGAIPSPLWVLMLTPALRTLAQSAIMPSSVMLGQSVLQVLHSMNVPTDLSAQHWLLPFKLHPVVPLLSIASRSRLACNSWPGE